MNYGMKQTSFYIDERRIHSLNVPSLSEIFILKKNEVQLTTVGNEIGMHKLSKRGHFIAVSVNNEEENERGKLCRLLFKSGFYGKRSWWLCLVEDEK